MIWQPIDDELRAIDGAWQLNVYHTPRGWGYSIDAHGRERAYGRADSEEQAKERAERLHAAMAALRAVAAECSAMVAS